MQHPDEETCAAIALGEPPDLEISAALEHLSSCAQCSEMVAELSSVRSLANGGMAGLLLQRPPSRVWTTIEANLNSQPDTAPSASFDSHLNATVDDERRLDSGLDREDVPGPGRSDPQSSPQAPVVTLADRRAARRPGRLSWVAGAAAAGLAIGLLGGRALFDRSEPAAPEPVMVARTVLQTLDTKTPVTDAQLIRDGERLGVHIDGTALPSAPGYLEVWLINTDGKRMVSLGVLNRQTGETFPVTQGMLDQGYLVVDVSRERFDDKPQHSGDSVARGSLPAV
ncbi:MAG TPA: anti-sigma factor [Dermatophilaceae bacterium]|nr:anti-sigma factor [Dermatophilaceae bacterium]